MLYSCECIEEVEHGYRKIRLYKDKYGVLDSLGDLEVPHIYSEMEIMKKLGFYVVRENQPGAMLSFGGKSIISNVFDSISPLKDEKSAYLEEYENEEEVPVFMSSEYYVVAINYKKGLINKTGSIIIPYNWDGIYYLNDLSVKVFGSGKYFFFDYNGTPK